MQPFRTTLSSVRGKGVNLLQNGPNTGMEQTLSRNSLKTKRIVGNCDLCEISVFGGKKKSSNCGLRSY